MKENKELELISFILNDRENLSTVIKEEKVRDLVHTQMELEKFFPNSEIKITYDKIGLKRDESITVSDKVLDIQDPQAFAKIVEKADYIDIYPLPGRGISIDVGFFNIKVMEEEV